MREKDMLELLRQRYTRVRRGTNMGQLTRSVANTREREVRAGF